MSASFTVRTSDDFPYVTIASMAVNTNDCFVAINGMKLTKGDVLYLRLDAGSEFNDELCANIPGPACGGGMGRAPEEPEGYVHVRPGIHDVCDPASAQYDWRNPMVEIKAM